MRHFLLAALRWAPAVTLLLALQALLLLLLAVASADAQLRRISAETAVQAQASALAIVRLSLVKSMVAAVMLGATACWAFFGYFIYRVTVFSVGVVYLLLYPVHPHYFRIERRYDTFITRKARVAFGLGTVTILGAVAAILLSEHTADIVDDNLAPIVTIAGRAAIAAVFVAYGITWSYALAMLRHRPQSRGLQAFLLSSDSHRTHFMYLAALLAFLGMLAWWLLPMIGTWFETIAATGARMLTEALEYQRLLDTASAADRSKVLPAVAALSRQLHILRTAADVTASPAIMTRGLHYLFLVSTLAGLAGIGLPTVVGAVRSLGYRRAVVALALGTLKSTLVAAGLMLFVERVYLVQSATSALWVGTFALLLTYILAHDDALHGTPVPDPVRPN